MAATTVFGCDWCDEIIEKDAAGKPKFAAKVTVERLGQLPGPPKVSKICARCKGVYDAVSQGKFRR